MYSIKYINQLIWNCFLQFIAAHQLRDTGAVASARAAEIYGLEILMDGIQVKLCPCGLWALKLIGMLNFRAILSFVYWPVWDVMTDGCCYVMLPSMNRTGGPRSEINVLCTLAFSLLRAYSRDDLNQGAHDDKICRMIWIMSLGF